MRSFEFITEAQNYNDMFANLLKVVGDHKGRSLKNDIKLNLDWAKEKLKRDDRIVWYMKNYRMNLINNVMTAHQPFKDKHDDPINGDQAVIYDKLVTIFQNAAAKTNSGDQFFGAPNALSFMKQNLEHYMSLTIPRPKPENPEQKVVPVPKILEVRWKNQSPEELYTEFRKYEEEWKNNQAEEMKWLDKETDDTELISFKGGKGWWLLNRYSCSAEADAMGHCGNSASGQEGERILSFRSTSEEGRHKPHLTFILDERGYLGETKGRGNHKPAEKYHPFIIKLLLHDIVKGIKGGGHETEGNFHLNDLSQQVREELVEKKPALGTLKMMYSKQGPSKDVIERCVSMISSYENLPEARYDPKLKKFILDEYKDISAFVDEVGGSIKHYMQYLDGTEHFDNWVDISSPDLKEFFNYLPEKQKDAVKAKIQEHKAEVDPDQEYDSLWELIDHNDMDDIKQAATWAMQDGYQAGAESELSNAVHASLDDLPVKYGAELISEDGSEWKWDTKLYLAMSVQSMTAMLSDEPEMEDVEYENSWFSGDEIKVDEGRYGFSGYDEEYAYERLEERLYEI